MHGIEEREVSNMHGREENNVPGKRRDNIKSSVVLVN